jgi:hypothetical protein
MDELGFRRARMFSWLSPPGLLQTASRAIISGVFARFADKREMEAALPITRLPDYSSEDEIWVDFVADIGDGFNSTYSVARLMAKEDLPLHDGEDTHRTRRGQVLVLGGDQVYPTADESAYSDKFMGPYRAALPWTAPGASPRLFAIPGNHDWYDGLTAFMRLLCRRTWVGGWLTEQERSYFAIKLPGRWWLWGIDIQFDAYIDEPQLQYFRDLAKGELGTGWPKVERGDLIILCTGKPSWVHEGLAGDERYKGTKVRGAFLAPRNLQYFEREIVRANGAEVRIALSGDLHHYARYESDDGRQRITSGGGGAYLYPTHVLDGEIYWQDTGKDPKGPKRRYELKAVYPDRDTSLRLRWGALLVPKTNPSFMGMTALVHLLIYWIILFGLSPSGRGLAAALRGASWSNVALALIRNPVGLLFCLLVLGGMYGFADAAKRLEKAAMALVHAGAHLGGAVTVIWAAARIPSIEGGVYLLVVALVVAAGGALAGSLVMGVYLVVAQLFRRHPNENFSSQHNQDYKNFLRLRIRSDGTADVFAVGIDHVPRKWDVRAEGGPSDAWVEPADGGLVPHLVEPRIHIGA